MAQLWMDGFDHYGTDVDNLLDGVWAELIGAVSLAPPAEGARTGPRNLRFDTSQNTNTARRVLGGDFSEIFAGFSLLVDALPGQSDETMPIRFKTSANASIGALTLRADGALEFRSGGPSGTILGSTAGPVIVASSQQYLEMRIVQDAAASIFELRVGEVVVMSLSGLNLGSVGIGQIDMGLLNIPTNSSPMYIDDLILRDASGTTNNTFMGDLRVATLQPIANGVSQGWAIRSKVKLGLGIMNFQDPTNRDMAITYGDNAVFELGSGDFAYEQFVRFDTLLTLSETATLASKHRATTNERSWRLHLNGPDVGANLVFTTSALGTAADEVNVHAFPFVPEINRWYHIAVSRSGTDSRMFIDGVQVGVTATDSRTYFDGTALLIINSRQDGADTVVDDESVDGWAEGVRLTVGAARYTADFTPPSLPLPADVGGDPLYNSVELLLNFDTGPVVLDESTNNFTGTIKNDAFVEFPDDAIAFQNVDGLTPDDDDFVEASLVAAKGTLNFAANALNTETVIVGATTYTFQTVLVDVANNVLIGATAEDSLDNLLAAVNLEAGAGTLYGTGTVQNVSAFLTDLPSAQVLATARTPGAAGNTIVTTTTVTSASWSAATLLGGLDIPSNSEFTVSQLPPEVTGVRSVAIIGRNFKTDSGSSEVQMSFVEQGGASDQGTARPVTINPLYYEDTFERDPNTLGPLTPSSILNARIRVDRTL